MSYIKKKQYLKNTFPGISGLRQLRSDELEAIYKQRIKGQAKPSGEGFKPLSQLPQHMVAGSLAKHINRVRSKRLATNIKAHAVMNNVDNQEYRKKLTQHLLRGG